MNNNPAARVLNFFEAVQAIEEKHGRITVLKAVKEVVSHTKDIPYVFRFLSQISFQVQQAHSSLVALEKAGNIRSSRAYTRWAVDTQSAFRTMNMGDYWDQFASFSKEDQFQDSLTAAADILSTTQPENVLNEGQIKQISNLLKELVHLIQESEIDPVIETKLIKLLDELADTLEQYNYLGSAVVQSELDLLIGSGFNDPEIVPATKKAGISEKFWKGVKAITLVVGAADGTLSLVNKAMDFIQEMDEEENE